MSPEPSKWSRIIAADPEHSRRYIERFHRLASEGVDLVGEARTIDAIVPRSARVLDAGCGPGRHGGYLHGAGHTVVGVDVDPTLIAAAEREHPGPTWLVGDLAELDLPARGIAEPFDAILCAGNVLGFLAPSTRITVLQRFGAHLKPNGRALIGFGAGRGYEFEDYFSDVAAAGLQVEQRYRSWELHPFNSDSDFLVSMLTRS